MEACRSNLELDLLFTPRPCDETSWMDRARSPEPFEEAMMDRELMNLVTLNRLRRKARSLQGVSSNLKRALVGLAVVQVSPQLSQLAWLLSEKMDWLAGVFYPCPQDAGLQEEP